MPVIRNLVPVVLVRNEEFWLPYTLEATRGWFDRYVIYDVGSEDRTRNILTNFMNTNPGVDFRYRALPMCETSVQGTFRNAMIAEAERDYYFILDGDEYWPQDALQALYDGMYDEMVTSKKLYGVVRRLEVTNDLKQIHGRNDYVKHHRVYHRTAIFTGPHPGEDPKYEQKDSNEFRFPKEAYCYHFHQPSRSSRDKEVPGREGRRYKPTYVRGNLTPLDLIAEIPMMAQPIQDYPVNPYLEAMQRRG